MECATLAGLILLFLITILIYSTWDKMYRNRNLPPGPMPLPIIGNLLLIKRGQLVKSLTQLKEKYGPVYTLYFGSRPVVILCGYQMVKKALIDQGEEFSNRGRVPTLDRFFKGQGILLSSGERWKQIRLFTMKTLKTLYTENKSIEERIQEEVQLFIKEIRKSKESPLNPTDLVTQAISNIASGLIFGNRFEYENTGILGLVRVFNATFQLLGTTWGQLQDMIPEIINHVPGPHQQIDKSLQAAFDFVSGIVQSHRASLDPSNPRDYIDYFLIKINQESQNPDSEFNAKSILHTVLQLFIAGTESANITLRHGLLLLVRYPKIQDKVYEEIVKVIGVNRSPTMEDRSKMPYTYAVIHEIQRFSDVLPLNFPHSPTKDVQLQGYTIPKGTDVYPMLHCSLRDPEYFKNPDKFDPGHFLNENGSFKKVDAFIAFSAGKRVCAGEAVARMELFLFLTSILQNFKLTPKRHYTDAEISPKMTGLTNIPIEYEVSFAPREL